ncbi:hypothetical protein [Micromonospora sp. NPDC126480]|uniref:hypothetical protein n=1 Tax=Micromonospora sp. NPDC126480 TaxID=3155312 RepID=UPI00332C40B0
MTEASTTPAPQFLPWLRTGLATAITEPARAGLSVHDTVSATVAVQLRATGDGGDRVDPITGPPVRLRGPADVVGLDPAQILRRHPEPGATDAEANYFAIVELAAPDLPWRYTPAAPDADGRLQPWLALVVVEDRAGVTLVERGPARCPVLHVDRVEAELPDLAQCWAWAHVQAEHDLTGGVAAALAETPEAFRARLMCPRRLPPDRSWIACLVPTFEAGRRAALGELGGSDLGPAWEPSGVDVELPVYDWWRFRTGAAGDFESLVRRLRPVELPAGVGRRDLDIGEPGGGLPRAPGTLVTYEGALVSPALGGVRPWPEPHRGETKAALRRTLNGSLRPAAPGDPGQSYDALRDDPVVGPPAYAASQAGRRRVPGPEQPPVWFEELNTEPPRRVVAGLGAEVVRADQEEMVAAAWRYAAEQVDVNGVLARARLGWELASTAQPKVGRLDDATLLQVAAPAMARLRLPDGGTVLGSLRTSGLPAGLLSGAFRRLTRTTRGLARTDAVIRSALADPAGFAAAWTTVRPPAGADLQASSGATPPAAGGRATGSGALPGAEPVDVPGPVVVPAAGSLAADVRSALDGPAAIVAMVEARVAGLPAGRDHAVPDRIWVRPEFTTPMYQRLLALSVEYLVPGIGAVPDDSLGLLRANQSFVEAFLAGMNHELGRELVWREYPARPSATWCRQFFDTGPGGPADIAVIRGWDPATGLGGHRPQEAPSADLVLLVKGALPRRYPDLRVYAVEAEWVDGRRREKAGGAVALPVFAGRLQRDAYFYGFALTVTEARGSTVEADHPGWFFVLEERPRAPRFGLDAPRDRFRGTAPARWSALSWAHLAGAGAPLPSFVDISGPQWLVGAGALRGNGGPDEWGADAAAMARITLQRPVRILTHADSMLPDPPSWPPGWTPGDILDDLPTGPPAPPGPIPGGRR